MMKKLFLSVLMLFCVSSVAVAQKLYKWTDPNGRVTYRDAPPPTGSGYNVEEKKVRSDAPYSSDDENPNSEAASNNPVVLYFVPKCPSCDLARSYLEKNKIPFKAVNVVSDPKLQQQLKKVSGTLSVPTITIGSKVIKGYTEAWVESELKAAGYSKPGEKKPEDS